jgi:hypothetical protein
MHVKTVEASNEKWIRKSIMAYLEGQKNLKWIVGVVGNCVLDARRMLIDLENYGNPKRHRDISDWCDTHIT